MKQAQGRTLIELLITLTIIGIIVGVGLPSFNQSLQQRQEQTVLKSLLHLSVYARTEAIRRNNYYTVCPSDNGLHCGGQWHRQIIVFSDYNKNKIIDGPDIMYRTLTFSASTPCIQWNLIQRQYLQFKPNGAANGTAGHFRFCDKVNSSIDKKMVISFNGRASIKNK